MNFKIGAIAICPKEDGFIGIRCAKGRGLILPGGKWESKDKSYHHTACREAEEEANIVCAPSSLRYVWHGPDGQGYLTFTFYCREYKIMSWDATEEGQPCIVGWADLFESSFGAYYRCLRDVVTRANWACAH